MAAATANAGIITYHLFRIRLICHKLGYVKFLGNVPLILSFGNSNGLGTFSVFEAHLLEFMKVK
jgi:hypothetical protein